MWRTAGFHVRGTVTDISFQKQIPGDIKFDPNATPPQYTDNGDQVIENGTHIRVKIIGIRPDVGKMYAVGSIMEDYLGYDVVEALATMILTWSQYFVLKEPQYQDADRSTNTELVRLNPLGLAKRGTSLS